MPYCEVLATECNLAANHVNLPIQAGVIVMSEVLAMRQAAS
jgi:hypothetical protein